MLDHRLFVEVMFTITCFVYFLFQYVNNNKESDNDWFRLESNKDGTRWFGKCWYIHELLKYEFDIEFDVSIVEWTQNLKANSRLRRIEFMQ